MPYVSYEPHISSVTLSKVPNSIARMHQECPMESLLALARFGGHDAVFAHESAGLPFAVVLKS